MKTYDGTRYAMVVTPGGNVVFHNEQSRVGEHVANRALLSAIAGQAETIVRHDEKGTAVFSAVVPVFGGDGAYAASVVVGFDAELVAGKVRKMLAIDLAISLLFFTAGVAALLIALSTFVTRPLARLVKAIEGARVDAPAGASGAVPGSRDEIGTLASTFDAMTAKLSKTVQGLNEQIAERKLKGLGLTSPEQAVLLAYSKMWLNDELIASDLPEDPWIATALERYFPTRLKGLAALLASFVRTIPSMSLQGRS